MAVVTVPGGADGLGQAVTVSGTSTDVLNLAAQIGNLLANTPNLAVQTVSGAGPLPDPPTTPRADQ